MSFKKSERQNRKAVTITRHVADSIITWAKTHHPNEAILVLQGKSTREQIEVDGVVIPPFSEMAHFTLAWIHDLPYTIPTLVQHTLIRRFKQSSLEDLHYFTVCIHHYQSPLWGQYHSAYDRNGNSLELKIVNSSWLFPAPKVELDSVLGASWNKRFVRHYWTLDSLWAEHTGHLSFTWSVKNVAHQ